MPDSKIDFTDAPQSSDEELRKARRVGRPRSGNAKQLIAIRLDRDLLAKLRKLASRRRKPYQALLRELLAEAIKKEAV